MGGLKRESWPGTKEGLWKTHFQAIYAATFATTNSAEVKDWGGLKKCSKIYSENNSNTWEFKTTKKGGEGHKDSGLFSLQKRSLSSTLFFFFLPRPWHSDFPRTGIKPAPQQ